MKFRTLICAAAGIMVICLSMALADPRVVKLSYAPEAQKVTIIVPFEDSAVPENLEVPPWLAPIDSAAGTMAFEGVLDEPGAQSAGLGATASEAFLLGALNWLPSEAGKPVDLLLTVPAPLRAVATGELLSETLTSAEYTAHYRLYGRPGHNGVFFGPYETATRNVVAQGHTVTVRTHFKSAQAEHAAAYLAATSQYIAQYAAEIGAYPHASFAVISAPIPVGYGLPGATFISEQILGHPYMLGRSLAHEVLHAWWGGAVGADYATGNWAEGLTTYQADHALAAERGPDTAKAMRRDWLSALTSLPRRADFPIRSFVSAGHNQDQSIGYGKAAMVFHMLERRLGSAIFDAGLAKFYTEHTGQITGWPDLKAAFDSVSDENLDAFFTQWLDRRGLPRVMPLTASTARQDNGFVVTLILRQAAAVYELTLPVVVETEDGTVIKDVFLDDRSAKFEITVPARPLSISVDPDFHVARQLLDGELPPTLRDVRLSDTYALMIAAEAAAAAMPLARSVFGDIDDVPQSELTAPAPVTDTILAIGATDEITALRAQHFAGAAPAVAIQGDSRVWVERDGDGRLWMFVSADAPDTLTEDLAALRYYANQSFLIVEQGQVSDSGRWPVEESPMRLVLE